MIADSDSSLTKSAGDAAVSELDRLCDEFESGWIDGEAPRIDEFLKRITHASAETVLVALVKLDLYYRERHGETPSLAKYETQFPEFKNVLQGLETQLPTHIIQSRELGNYRLLRPVGHGGFGDVWEAMDTQLKRRVAIKTPRDRTPDPTQVRMFLREAQTAAQLDHHRVARVYGFGEIAGRAYICSEFVDGPTLSRWVKWNDVSPREAARICLEIAEGLIAAHAAKVVHRDLKPGNILMTSAATRPETLPVTPASASRNSGTEVHPKIVDFGLAKRLDSTSTIGANDAVMGTYAYMSPEQARGKSSEVDPRSDVYSLGTILYELMTNRVPFKGTTTEVLSQIIHREPVSPRSLNHAIPRDLETICLKALSKAPKERYQSAQDLWEDLHHFLNDEPIQARSLSLFGKSCRWIKRNKAVSSLIALSTVVAFSIGGISWSNYEAYLSARQIVRLDTQPGGARVVFYPLDPETGEPLVHLSATYGRAPVQELMLPGDYLVVAYHDEDTFHEVLRHVPTQNEQSQTAEAQNHRRWELEGRQIRLPDVRIPDPRSSNAGMANVPATEFTIGSPAATGLLTPHRQIVPEFLMDQREVSYRDFEELNQSPWSYDCGVPHKPDDALCCVDWDRAVAFAETIGKRLPTEAEFERVARGIRRVDEFGVDRVTIDSQEISGLTSRVREWTATWAQTYPGAEVSGADSTKRIVRGGYGDANEDSIIDPAQLRMALPTTTFQNNLGFRCVRSRKPRLNATDFERAIE